MAQSETQQEKSPKSLKKVLKEHLVSCAQHNKEKRFIPRRQLQTTCNIKAVRRELKRVYPRSDPDFCEQLASLICHDQTRNSSAISKPYLKIFAILALIKEAKLIDFFRKQSLCDDDLPFQSTSDFQRMWPKNKEEKDHLQFPEGVDDDFVEDFVRVQWQLLAPSFKSPESSSLRCNFYEFDDKTILPITKVSKNKHTGGFGVVERIQLHEEHHEFVSSTICFQSLATLINNYRNTHILP
jgi:hypothetical protein